MATLSGKSEGVGDLLLFLLREGALGLPRSASPGGFLLVQLVNRLPISTGLYPILVMAGALAIFSGTQLLDGSGYLAVYLRGW